MNRCECVETRLAISGFELKNIYITLVSFLIVKKKLVNNNLSQINYQTKTFVREILINPSRVDKSQQRKYFQYFFITFLSLSMRTDSFISYAYVFPRCKYSHSRGDHASGNAADVKRFHFKLKRIKFGTNVPNISAPD